MPNKILQDNKKMIVGKVYDAVFATGRYEIEYETAVRCIKITPQSYRIERQDGTTRLIKQGLILELKEIYEHPGFD